MGKNTIVVCVCVCVFISTVKVNLRKKDRKGYIGRSGGDARCL